jgi:hypothetical protein
MIREIFNKCSGNQMRDVFVREIECDDTGEYLKQFLVGGEITCEKMPDKNGTVIYDVVIDGLRQRFSFTGAD